MADGDTVKMRLTFWRDDKKPGDLIDVPADEVHRWKGFAVEVDEPAPTGPNGRPADSASVAEWRAYCMRLGMEKPDADKASKQELQTYASRATAGAKA
ncbi:hypothetical protein ACIQMV_08840 [Streptomyces sp. NPDC091412]|uniref:hypothetical protein n=1 Tax=Streptomyces sp. NPDC091412 TaxID=3366002 RepID=UPI003806A641